MDEPINQAEDVVIRIPADVQVCGTLHFERNGTRIDIDLYDTAWTRQKGATRGMPAGQFATLLHPALCQLTPAKAVKADA